MKLLWVLVISCFLMVHAVNVSAMQAANPTPTPDSGCGANSATGGCTTGTGKSGKKGHKGGKKSKKSTGKNTGSSTTPPPK